MDCFYAQVETVLNPSLAGTPIGIQQKYLLVTCNYEARARGVTKLQGLTEARKRCPEITILNGEDLTEYREASERIHAFMRERFPLVQRQGMDENFIDVTEAANELLRRSACIGSSSSSSSGSVSGTESAQFDGHLYQGEGAALTEDQTGTSITVAGSCENSNGSSLDGNHFNGSESVQECKCGCRERLAAASQVVGELRRALKAELGYTSCAGIGVNKLSAKLAAELHKPNQQTTLLPHHVPRIVAALPLRKLPGCGSATTRAVEAALGITTAAHALSQPWPLMHQALGDKTAALIYRLCRGADATAAAAEVVPSPPPKTMSDEDTYKSGTVTKRSDLRARLAGLAAALLRRAGRRREQLGEVPQTLRLSVRRRIEGRHNSRESRQGPVPAGVVAPFAAAPAAHGAVVAVRERSGVPMASDDEAALSLGSGTGSGRSGGESDGGVVVCAKREAAIAAMVSALLALFDRIVAPNIPFDLALINVCFASFVKDTTAGQSAIHTYFRRGSIGNGSSSNSESESSGGGGGADSAVAQRRGSSSAERGSGGGGSDGSGGQADGDSSVILCAGGGDATPPGGTTSMAAACAEEASPGGKRSTTQSAPRADQEDAADAHMPDLFARKERKELSTACGSGAVDMSVLMELPPSIRAEVLAAQQQQQLPRKRAKRDIRSFFAAP